mgnify:CR=1 FL=1
MSDNFQLLLPHDYVRDLIKKIDRAERRVLMIALVITDDEATSEVIAAIERAARRGVQVSVGFDVYFTYREIEVSATRLSAVRRQLGRMRSMRKRLVASGAEVRWLGMFGMTLFSRRTHIKWTVVDDIVYSFGGVNLYSAGVSNNDYMMRASDAVLAEHVSAEHHRVIATDRAGVGYNSHAIKLPPHSILIDGGKIGDSIIYKRALALSRRATEITYVSQYCPTGRLAGSIRRHKNAKIYFNPWRNASDPLNRTLIRVSVFWHGIQTLYTRKDYLHAKFMIFTMPDGSKTAITGSHNFVAAGGLLGTREVALETHDRQVIKQLEEYVKSHLS